MSQAIKLSVVELNDNSNYEADRSLLKLLPDEEDLLKSAAGITEGAPDSEELKQHIFTVQEEACKVYPFPCIKTFSFVGFRAARYPIYKHVVNLGRERSDAIYLEIGCCVGNDVRKLIDDGYPVENIVATDLTPDFWDIGHKLYHSTPESLAAKFVAGDIFDPAHLALVEDLTTISSPRPSLQSLTSLNPLRGHVSAIHASFFFHLFSEDRQFELARLLAGLLDPRPGSTIFGSHVGLREKGDISVIVFNDKWDLFCHSPESWTEMWDQVFGKGVVEVNAYLREMEKHYYDGEKEMFWLTWSVVRL